MTDISLREFFQKVVDDASVAGNREELKIPTLRCGSQRAEWFKRNGKQCGRFAHLTPEYIATAPPNLLEQELILLIAACFQQR